MKPVTMMQAYSIPQAGAAGRVMEIPKPEPEQDGFALIRVLRAGVCNTDLEILKGYMGFTGVLGHEFVGVVESVHNADRDGDWVGKRVCGDINVCCSNAKDCRVCGKAYDSGCSKMSRNHCPNRTVLGILNRNGTMAEYLTLPVHNLHVVREDISDEVAVFAEPLAAACRIVEQGLVSYEIPSESNDKAPDRVAILGDGKLGLMIAEALGREHQAKLHDSNNNNIQRQQQQQQYPRPVLFGKHQHKLDLVATSAGIDTKFVADAIDENSLNGVAPKYAASFDVVVEATGSPTGLQLASGLLRPMGTLCLKSTCAVGAENFNPAPFVIDELRVVGSRCGPIDKALELLGLGANADNNNGIRPLNVEKYVTKTFPLSEAKEAIKCAAERSTMKVQIVCNEE
mmetsp:Transcript_45940/g.53111  ORF Transcript_45940/g.53111 Transcript_45940/m.53111 type:complete len:399 (-) Transcript_45940:161-1357(-)